jgi:hypothetical protein
LKIKLLERKFEVLSALEKNRLFCFAINYILHKYNGSKSTLFSSEHVFDALKSTTNRPIEELLLIGTLADNIFFLPNPESACKLILERLLKSFEIDRKAK